MRSEALPTQTEMIAYLDRYVRGQKTTKQAIATAIYEHYLGHALSESESGGCRDFGPQHILVIGPTGSGKTYLIRKLSEYLNVPIVFASAASMSGTGYVGSKPQTFVQRLLHMRGMDPREAEKGIIFLDEFDKVRKVSGEWRDVSGEDVQNSLLTFLDGGKTPIPTDREEREFVTVDVSKILFICSGAFVGLTDIVRQRCNIAEPFGFNQDSGAEGNASATDDEILARVEDQDVIDFGFIPELIGRFGAITRLHHLSEEDLIAILTTTEGSILRKRQALFGVHGIELTYTPAALTAIARKSIGMNIGARGLNQIVLKSTDAVEWRLHELYQEGVRRIEIDADVIDGTGEPRLSNDTSDPSVRLEPVANELRARALGKAIPAEKYIATDKGFITNTSGWSRAKLSEELEKIKEEHLDWPNTTGSAKKWWEAFEKENQHRLELIYRLAEELRNRKATITEFFLAYVYSNTDNIQGNLYYLDYTRLKKEEERKRKEALNNKQRFHTGETVPGGEAGSYCFGGYCDSDQAVDPGDEEQGITLDEGDEFPASSSGLDCWWEKVADDVPF